MSYQPVVEMECETVSWSHPVTETGFGAPSAYIVSVNGGAKTGYMPGEVIEFVQEAGVQWSVTLWANYPGMSFDHQIGQSKQFTDVCGVPLVPLEPAIPVVPLTPLEPAIPVLPEEPEPEVPLEEPEEEPEPVEEPEEEPVDEPEPESELIEEPEPVEDPVDEPEVVEDPAETPTEEPEDDPLEETTVDAPTQVAQDAPEQSQGAPTKTDTTETTHVVDTPTELAYTGGIDPTAGILGAVLLVAGGVALMKRKIRA